MQFYDKDIETEIILEDGRAFYAKSNIEFRVNFEARSYGIKDTYVQVDAIRAYWTDDDDDNEVDFEFEYNVLNAKLTINERDFWEEKDALNFDTIIKLDTTGSGMIIVHNIVIDLANKTIELSF